MKLFCCMIQLLWWDHWPVLGRRVSPICSMRVKSGCFGAFVVRVCKGESGDNFGEMQ